MSRTVGTGHRLAILVVPLAVLALLITGGLAVGAIGSSPSSAAQPEVTYSGSWTITTAVSYSDTSVLVNGSITIEAGGSLTLQNVTLSLSEPSSLEYGITVEEGGGLYTTDSTIQSATPANHLWMRANSGAHLSMVGGSVLYLGGSASTLGFEVDAADASFNGVTFNGYYEALIVSAIDVTVEDCTFEASTSPSSTTWVVSTSGTSSGFVMTHSTIDDTSMIGGALSLASASTIEYNTFTLDPKATNPTPILIGYSGSNQRVNASGTTFSYNTVTGSDVVDFSSSDVAITHNHISNTGGAQYVHDYGVRVETMNPSGTAIWTSGVDIEYNFISDSTSYGIRVEQNIANILISHNNITNISTDPQAGSYNGESTYIGIYLIRGVRDAVVSYNYVDGTNDQSNSAIDDNGIALESEVDNSVVSDNIVRNWDLGIVVQGDWNDGSGNIGPSLHNTVSGNTFQNTLAVVEKGDISEAIDLWDWSNYTVVSNNLIEGWNLVPSGVSTYEGAAIHTSSTYGTISGNVVNEATYGVVFGYYYGAGEGNSSYNVVNDNVFNVTSSVIVNDKNSDPSPQLNVLNLLSPKKTSSGFPTSSLTSIGPVTGLGFSESSGAYSVTLQTHSPVTGAVTNFTSSLPWNEPKFSVFASGAFGSGTVTASVTSLTSTEVTYSVIPSGTIYNSVSLAVPTLNYSAAYTVHVHVGTTTQNFTVSSSTGPAAFETNGTGTVSIVVGLDSWTPIITNNTTVTLQLDVQTPGGNPVAGITAQIGLYEPTQSTSVTLGPTDSLGDANVSGLPSGTAVTSVTLEGSAYYLGNYLVVTPQPGLIQLSVVAVLGVPVTNTTAPNYSVEFAESGLSPGAAWWVSVTGPQSVNVTLSAPLVTFNFPSGTYVYSVGGISGTNTSAPGGKFTLPAGASPLVFNITFTQSQSSGHGPGSPTSGAAIAGLPSWVAASLYLFVTAFEVALFIGLYLLYRGNGSHPKPRSRSAPAKPRRGRSRPRKR